ncbi:hypothetical protein B005_0838 [Nocardiopsis alba ATCC BAA-2165]|uniref:Uncharacterized protein n=1 Tax=Nocardiopsis alba (strain ATCC BAA-2165 / BE74) TaxID=1205910 RepID=J7L968_NOCAA|nr:hypothetical protein B005_0838 [Nocardiopsis alba ATCC BAA-2165]
MAREEFRHAPSLARLGVLDQDHNVDNMLAAFTECKASFKAFPFVLMNEEKRALCKEKPPSP